MRVNAEAHWRDSARSIRFFIWDGKAAFPMLLFLLHMRIWTLVLAVAAMMFFTLLNRYGFTPVVFFRYLRNLASGRRKISRPWWTN